MTNLYEINGTCGSDETECSIFVYEQPNGSKWYCVEDSVNVNCTYDEIGEGCDVELLNDCDCYTASDAITSLDELERFIDDDGEQESKYEYLEIEINNFDNAAMVDAPKEEVIRILKGIINNIENNGLYNCDGLLLKDSNGNSVGDVSVGVNY